jgi:hypothetical protein
VATGYEAENRRVVEECCRHPDRLVPFARLDPRAVSKQDASDALAEGARGFKLHPRAEDFRVAELIEEAASGSAKGPWALAMALAILATPGVESGALVG